jgi:hypothetical protein
MAVSECLPSKQEALSSTPVLSKNKKKEKNSEKRPWCTVGTVAVEYT